MMSMGWILIHVDVLFRFGYEPDHGYLGILTRCFYESLMSGIALHVASLHGGSMVDSFDD